MNKHFCDAPRDCGCTMWDYGKVNPVCAEIDCLNYTKREPPTNADRIRAMSDEDLARFLIEVENRRSCCGGGAKWNGLAHVRNWLMLPAKEEEYAEN